jgi:hypothetical protein
LNCRCDPRCRTMDQPSSSSCFTTSRPSHRDHCPTMRTGHACPASPSITTRSGGHKSGSHVPANAASHSEISASDALLGLPWTEGIAGLVTVTLAKGPWANIWRMCYPPLR